MLSLDTEVTGLDLYHGAKPYFVTICHEDGTQQWWEWPVDPVTREPEIPENELEEIRALLYREANWSTWDKETAERHTIVGQNVKFDVTALATIGVDNWPWQQTHDTLVAGHLLASNQPHDLTSMALHYLGIDIEPSEKALEEACKEARRMVQQAQLRVKRATKLVPSPTLFGPDIGLDTLEEPLASYRIASVDQPDMPSVKEKSWKNDGWLPKALAEELDYPPDHPWHTVLRDYGNADSAVTIALWQVMRDELHKRGLWETYLECRKIPPVLLGMERKGVTYSLASANRLKDQFRAESTESKRICLSIAKDLHYDLELPKGASPNGSLRRFIFDVLELEPIQGFKSKTVAPTLDKAALDHYETTLPPGHALDFIRHLRLGRKRDTYLAYLESYERFGIPIEGLPEWLILHPSINQTGTDTLRPSSNNPNGQNVGKQELEGESDKGKLSLRYAFGPGPGREWWALDYENIELRIPAYASGEEKMVELFERPDEPPFFGSYHLLNGSIIYPDLFWPLADKKGAFKDKYNDTWYQWLKNFDFAVQYGAQRSTADRAAHKHGAFDAVQASLPKVARLKQQVIQFAEKNGYVETIPDRTVNPKRGYPLLVSRSEYGKIVPTIPFAYFVQGTAMWCARRALVRCAEQLIEWNTLDRRRYHTVLFVHDELVFDFPEGGKRNLPKVRQLQRLMEKSGEDISIPLKVAVSYHPKNWAEKVKL